MSGGKADGKISVGDVNKFLDKVGMNDKRGDGDFGAKFTTEELFLVRAMSSRWNDAQGKELRDNGEFITRDTMFNGAPQHVIDKIVKAGKALSKEQVHKLTTPIPPRKPKIEDYLR